MSLARLNAASWAWLFAGSLLFLVHIHWNAQEESFRADACIFHGFSCKTTKQTNRGYIVGPMRKPAWNARLHESQLRFIGDVFLIKVSLPCVSAASKQVKSLWYFVLQLLRDTRSASELPRLPTSGCPWHVLQDETIGLCARGPLCVLPFRDLKDRLHRTWKFFLKQTLSPSWILKSSKSLSGENPKKILLGISRRSVCNPAMKC